MAALVLTGGPFPRVSALLASAMRQKPTVVGCHCTSLEPMRSRFTLVHTVNFFRLDGETRRRGYPRTYEQVPIGATPEAQRISRRLDGPPLVHALRLGGRQPAIVSINSRRQEVHQLAATLLRSDG